MTDDRSSGSLFSSNTNTPTDDVRHDINTVHGAWSHESRRRTRRALVFLIPGFIIALGIYAFLAYNCDDIPGYEIFHPIPEPPQNSILDLGGETYTVPANSFGFPEAKVKISLVASLAPEKLLKILHMAVDDKPSEIFVELVDTKDVPQDELGRLRDNDSCRLTINGQTQFTLGTGKDAQTIYIDLPIDAGYRPVDLQAVIRQVHEKEYGPTPYPVFRPVNADVTKAEAKLGDGHSHGDGHHHDDDEDREPPDVTPPNFDSFTPQQIP